MTHMWALYAREVKRFQKLWLDTIFSPIVQVLLFLVVFRAMIVEQEVAGINFIAFVYAGLIGMTLVNNSFSNPVFALIISKNIGNIIDLQIAPIKPWKIGVAYVLAALTRAAITVVITAALTIWFVDGLTIPNIPMLLLAIALTGIEFGLLGVTFGMWAKNFESLTFIMTFVMQPMIFLAGVFYPIATLPEPWNVVSLFNPLHHNINLVRYAMTGYSDISPWISAGVCLAISTVFFFLMRWLIDRKLRTAT